MDKTYLDFERPIAELETRIEELQQVSGDGEASLADEIGRLKRKSRKLTESLFSALNAWQVTQLARHPDRPYTQDYLADIFTEFEELHGDRMFADDHAIIAGVGRLDGVAVAVIGHQKGRGTREKVYRNFGMPRPEGYRKAQRIMRLAERFQLPLITLIDTTGAYPGIDAEQRGQSEAIARCLLLLADLRTPILAAVIGEGGSGGALAIGVADRLLMMQYATYSVISPEGCASILWKKSERAAEAAEAMGLTTERLKQLELIDEIIPEPLGGAHRDRDSAALALQGALIRNLHELRQIPIESLIESRKSRLKNYGRFEGGH